MYFEYVIQEKSHVFQSALITEFHANYQQFRDVLRRM